MTGVTLGTAAGAKDLTEIWVGTAGGNKQLTELWVGTSGGNKQIYTSVLSAAATGSGSRAAGSLSCVATGGTPPYTYLWGETGGDLDSFTDHGDGTADFSSSGDDPLTFFCLVTDHVGTSVTSNDVGY